MSNHENSHQNYLSESMKIKIDEMLWSMQLNDKVVDPEELVINKIQFLSNLINGIFISSEMLIQSEEVDESVGASAMVLIIKMRRSIFDYIQKEFISAEEALFAYRKFFLRMIDVCDLHRGEFSEGFNEDFYNELSVVFNSAIEFIDYK